MDLSQIISGALPAALQYILAPATFLVFLILLFVYWRSGSSHALLLKTWLLVFGQTVTNSKAIKQFADDEFDLTQFRYLTGIKVSTIKEAEHLSIWGREHNIGLRTIRKAGRFFDIEKPGPAQPLFTLRRRHLLWRVLAFMVLVPFFAITLGLTQYQRAVIRVRPTDTYFTVDKQFGAPLMRAGKFYFKGCKSDATSEAIDEVSLKILCALNDEKDIDAKLAEIVRDQQIAAWTACGYLLFPLFLAFASIARVRAAFTLRRRLSAYQQQRQQTLDDQTKVIDATADLSVATCELESHNLGIVASSR
jgi:hypothetical protein